MHVVAPDDVVAVWTPVGADAPLVFQRVKGQHLAQCWPALRPFIAAACEKSGGRFTVEWVVERLANRVDALWALMEADGTPRGAATTHLGRYPSGAVHLEVLMAGGREIGRANANAVLQALRAYRDAQGAAEIEWTGRPGLARWLGAGRARVIGTACVA